MPLIRTLIVLTALAGVAQAETPTTQPATAPARDGIVETSHALQLDDTRLSYTASAGTLPLADDAGKKRADVFFIAYQRTGEGIDRTTRPITFVFNGGPGAAAVWLHLGTAGPQMIDVPADGQAPSPPYRLQDNDATWLTYTDLVFVDPVGTGFSRPAEGVKGDEFYGLREDIAAVGSFIRLYATRYGRHLSPMFLAGESYGTTRAAGLASHLLDEEGIAISGIILISSVLDFATLRGGDSNDLPHALFLPTYTAVAYHHKRLAKEVQASDRAALLEEVQKFAIDNYLSGLARGATLPAEERKPLAHLLARYTGLAVNVIDESNLRISPWLFMTQTLRDRKLLLGRFDARLTGFNATPLTPYPEYDPSLSRFLPAYSATFNHYVRNTLGYETDRKYEVLSGLVHPWNFGESGQGFPNTADDLAEALRKNPAMKVMFASGFHDLATPYYATDYTISQLRLSDGLRRNIAHRVYEGGHMMYHVAASRQQLGRDIGGFIVEAAAVQADR